MTLILEISDFFDDDPPQDESPQEVPEEEASSEKGDPQENTDEALIDEEALASKWAEQAADTDNTIHEKGILDQAEIDTLLGGNQEDTPDRVGVDVLLDSSTISYERLPMLEVAFDHLVKLLTTALRNFTSDTVEVRLEHMSSVRFGDYIDSIPLPALIGVFRAAQWENNPFIININSSLTYAIVDVLLGGRKGTPPNRTEGRPYSTIERNLILRLFHVVLKELSSAFEPITHVDFNFDRIETSPRFATIARPVNASIVVSIRIEMDERAGNIEFLLPYASLEPARELLLQMFRGENLAMIIFGKITWPVNSGRHRWI